MHDFIKNKNRVLNSVLENAERAGFEPVTSTVTVWRSNQLNYRSFSILLTKIYYQ